MMCPRCHDRKVIDPLFLQEAKNSFIKLMAELVLFAHANKIDHRKMPVLTEVATVIRIMEMF